MAYDFQTESFRRLDSALRDHPDGVPYDPERLRELSDLYIDAASNLLRLMRLIMSARLRESRRGPRFERFIGIYEHRVDALITELRDFLLGGLERRELGDVAVFLEGVRRGAIAEEMVALHATVDDSSGEGEDAEADEAAGTEVTNSLKKHIEERVKSKWIKDILHAINEILSIVRGAV